MYSKYLSYLYKKCFNASQTAEILNLVVFPSLTYRMNIIKFPAPTIKKWDKQARNLLAYKLRENQFIGSLHWYLPNNKYGYNLFKLTDLQTICLPANYLNYSANFIDVYARRSTLAIFDQSLITEQSATLLSRYKYEVARNYEYKLQPDGEIGKYFDNKTLLTNLMARGVNDITTIMNDDKLKTLEEMTDIIGDWTKRKQKYLQNNVCVSKTNTIKPFILKRLEQVKKWKISPDTMHLDQDYMGYEVYIDESLKNNKAGYGIWFGDKHEYNFYSRVEGEQTLQNATY